MEQINLMQAKGGQGTSVTACAVALRAAGNGLAVRLDGHDRASLAAILGRPGDGSVIGGLILGPAGPERHDLVVHDGPADSGVSLLVTRPCYLALRNAVSHDRRADAAGIVLIDEAGRSLGAEDVAAVTALPVVATIPVRAGIARAVDAGVLADRLPEPLATAARQILSFALTGTGKEVA